MKRMVKFMLTPLLVFAMFTITFASSPSIVISNETLPVSAVSQEGRVLVPLRAIFESLDAKVDYNSATKTITTNQNGKIIILKINEKVATVDGEKVILDVPASVIKGSALVPVRFIGESLGAKVDWHNNTVLINSDRDMVGKASNSEVREKYNRDKERLHIVNDLLELYLTEIHDEHDSLIGENGWVLLEHIMGNYEVLKKYSMETPEGKEVKKLYEVTMLNTARVIQDLANYDLINLYNTEQLLLSTEVLIESLYNFWDIVESK